MFIKEYMYVQYLSAFIFMWTFNLTSTRLEYLYTISLPVVIVGSARRKHFLLCPHVLHAYIIMCELKSYISV